MRKKTAVLCDPDLSYEREGAGEIRMAKIRLLVDGMGEKKREKKQHQETCKSS